MEISDFLIRIVIALICGAVIGLERQLNKKSIGLRTNTLVTLGATIFVILSTQIIDGDISRIIGQVVTGIGFLGAGVIIHEGADVQGLNTAATIWCSSAVGCLIGTGYYTQAIICTVTIVAINVVFMIIDHRLKR